MACTNTHSCVIQCDTEAQYLAAAAQLDAYTAASRLPVLADRVDDAVALSITFGYVETLDLG